YEAIAWGLAVLATAAVAHELAKNPPTTPVWLQPNPPLTPTEPLPPMPPMEISHKRHEVAQIPPMAIAHTPQVSTTQFLPTQADISNVMASKAVNLPAWKTIGIDLPHIVSGHTATGERIK